MKQFIAHHGSEPLEIRNTGLRPNWNSFWAQEASSTDTESGHRALQSSFLSSKSAMSGVTSATVGAGIKHVRFITGSEWIGEWDRSGMAVMGMYKMPHGVIYEGTMKAGLFEGVGVLKYPNGSSLEGLWYHGKLKYWQYEYADGLEHDCQGWAYCAMPDRRFYSEHVSGLRPATREQMTNHHPAREVPPGHYDVGQGFYNPKSHCVVDVVTGDVISIPTADEEKWILDKCRSAEPTETVGYRPDLYENWFKIPTGLPVGLSSENEYKNSEHEFGWEDLLKSDSDDSQIEESDLEQPQEESGKAFANAEKVILSLLQQEGAVLHTVNSNLYSNHRKLSLHEKLENQGASEQGVEDQGLSEQFRASSLEGLLKKIIKEIGLQKPSVITSDESGRKTDTLSNESNLYRLTQFVSAYADTAGRKKARSTSLQNSGALEQFKILGKLLPSISLTTSKHFPSPASLGMYSYDLDSDKLERLLSGGVKDTSEESMITSTNYEASENDQ